MVRSPLISLSALFVSDNFRSEVFQTGTADAFEVVSYFVKSITGWPKYLR